MKKIFSIILCFLIFTCERDTNNTNCNFLLNVGVNFTINLDLPQFNPLRFPSNPIRVEGQGNAGVILMRINGDLIRAWDGADPNHAPSPCSRLEIEGLIAVCGCSDANKYQIIDGQIFDGPAQPCGLREYRVQPIGGNSFSITN